MNRRLAAVLALPALMLGVSACGGDEDVPKPEATTPAPAVKAIPSPAPNEAVALMDGLEQIVPGVYVDRGKAVDAARGTCESILGGAQNLQAATITRFTAGLDVDEVTPAQADQIVALVKAEPWCK